MHIYVLIVGVNKKFGVPKEFDCTIAGVYLSNNINKIITKNVKRFENILGLKVISYYNERR